MQTNIVGFLHPTWCRIFERISLSWFSSRAISAFWCWWQLLSSFYQSICHIIIEVVKSKHLLTILRLPVWTEFPSSCETAPWDEPRTSVRSFQPDSSMMLLSSTGQRFALWMQDSGFWRYRNPLHLCSPWFVNADSIRAFFPSSLMPHHSPCSKSWCIKWNKLFSPNVFQNIISYLNALKPSFLKHA